MQELEHSLGSIKSGSSTVVTVVVLLVSNNGSNGA